jgi:hypothetical protein
MAGFEWDTLPRANGRLTADSALAPLVEDAVISDNDLESLAYAVAMRADMGRLRCENNRVSDGTAGFILTAVDLQLSRERLLQAAEESTQSDEALKYYRTMQYSAQAGIAEAMMDFARATPLPGASEQGHWARIGQSPSAAHTKQMRAEAIAMAKQYSQTNNPRPAAPAAAEKAAPEQKAPAKPDAALIEDIRRRTDSMMISPIEQPVPKIQKHVPVIRFAGNEINILPVGNHASDAYIGLFMMFYQTAATVMVTANDIRGNAPGQIVEIAFPILATITGNMFVNNYGHDALCLQVDTKSSDGKRDDSVISLSGNVLIGPFKISTPSALGCESEEWTDLNSQRSL